MIYFIINHSDLSYPIEIPLSKASVITGADILTLFQKVIISNQKPVFWNWLISNRIIIKKSRPITIFYLFSVIYIRYYNPDNYIYERLLNLNIWQTRRTIF